MRKLLYFPNFFFKTSVNRWRKKTFISVKTEERLHRFNQNVEPPSLLKFFIFFPRTLSPCLMSF